MEVDESTVQQLFSRIAALETRLNAVEAGGGKFETQSSEAEEPAAGSDDVIIPDIVVEPGAMESSNKFLFKLSLGKSDSESESEEEEWKKATIGEGAIQVGGYTYFVDKDKIDIPKDGTVLICVSIILTRYETSFVYYGQDDLEYEQEDTGRFIVPLYKIVDGEVAVDYRPMPMLGIWEDQP